MIEDKELLVKKSTLPAAGKGLFTKKLIPKGTRIVEYTGKIRKWNEVKNAEADNLYIMYVTRDHVIDAGPYKNAKARFANDASGLMRVKGILNNSIYVKDGLRVFIEATKNIPAGNEIFVDYGKDYWNTVKYNTSIETTNKNNAGRKKRK